MSGKMIDVAKVAKAIDGVFDVLASLDMTVAECVLVTRSIDSTLKSRYGDQYDAVMDACEIQDAVDAIG